MENNINIIIKIVCDLKKNLGYIYNVKMISNRIMINTNEINNIRKTKLCNYIGYNNIENGYLDITDFYIKDNELNII